MKSNRPLILISNDDGYHAPGIKKLVDIVRPLADVLVVQDPKVHVPDIPVPSPRLIIYDSSRATTWAKPQCGHVPARLSTA